MRKYITITALAFITITACVILSACTKDRGFRTVKIYTPVLKPLQQVYAAINTGAPEAIVTPGKMFLLGKYIFLNEINKGIHIIDNSNPASPVNKAFINIPGNLDITIKGNTLYADCFTELLVIDISNISTIQFKKSFAKIFPDRSWMMGTTIPDGYAVIDWKVRDTMTDIAVTEGQGLWKNNEYYTGGYFNPGGLQTASSTYNNSANTASVNGVAGSTARFAILNNYLYTVSASMLHSFDISNAAEPTLANTGSTYVDAETIFAMNNRLFIGGSNGISIFNVDNAMAPVQEGGFGHFCSGDPVIADDNTAYVTLHTGNWCQDDIDELDVLDITDITQPKFIKTYKLTRPNGLSKDGSTLFVCDGDGLKIFNAAQAANLTLMKTIAVSNPSDVICNNKVAFVSAKDGLYQFDYHDMNNIKLLSKIGMGE